MSTALDFKSISGITKEMREELVATFDALSNWRSEIETANNRCLGKVLDRTAAVARAMGWPDQAVRSTREYLESASKAQTEMIDQIVEGWKGQLKSSTAPMAIPRSLSAQGPDLASAFAGAKPEFNPLAPWMFWLQAAKMWQRTWMPDTMSQKDSRPH
jgi:hypothetical protein